MQGLSDALPVPCHASRSPRPASPWRGRRVRQSTDAVLRLQCSQGHWNSRGVARQAEGGRNPRKVSVHLGLATFVLNSVWRSKALRSSRCESRPATIVPVVMLSSAGEPLSRNMIGGFHST